MQVEFLAFLLVYFVLILSASFLFTRKMKTIEDFFLASRSLPASLVFLSLSASWFGATSTLVSTDEAFELGVSSFWVIGMPTVVTVLVLAVFLARPIRRLPIVSLPDLVELRYGRGVRFLASILIIWYMVVLAASQMVAIGNFLKVFLGSSYFFSLALGTAIVLLYAVFGGFFSVVVTDSLQFFLLTAGIVGLFLFLVTSTQVAEIPALVLQEGKGQYFDFFFDLKRSILILLSFTLAWTISPIAWQRIQAAKTAKTAQQGLFASSIVFFILYWTVVAIGMLSFPLFRGQKMKSPVLSELISSKVGVFLGAVLFVAIVAAIMSTMDSAINTGALTLTRDLYQQIFSSSRAKGIISISRISTLVVGLLAFGVATRFQSILKTLGLASEIMAEGLFVPGMAMIFLKKRLPTAGFLSLALGGGYSLARFLSEFDLFFIDLPAWPMSLPQGLGLCVAGFITGFIIDQYVKHPQKE